MNWFRRIQSRASDNADSRHSTDVGATMFARCIDQAEGGLRNAFTSALHMQNWHTGLFSHSARVAVLSGEIARRMGMPKDDIKTLTHAAELHEIGMVAVPVELLETPRELTPAEKLRVRSQAWIGAEILRTAYPPLKGDLVEAQYTDFASLHTRFSEASPAYTMAGILRVADVFDTLTNPRPYQQNIPKDAWRDVVESGFGKLFHPEATEALVAICG